MKYFQHEMCNLIGWFDGTVVQIMFNKHPIFNSPPLKLSCSLCSLANKYPLFSIALAQ